MNVSMRIMTWRVRIFNDFTNPNLPGRYGLSSPNPFCHSSSCFFLHASFMFFVFAVSEIVDVGHDVSSDSSQLVQLTDRICMCIW